MNTQIQSELGHQHQLTTADKLIFPTILLVAGLFRYYHLDTRSLWLDEYTSIEVATKSLWAIVTSDGFNSHTPPLYYILLHGWFKLVPANSVSLRLFSLAFDILNLVLLYLVVGRQFSYRRAMIVTLMYAVSSYAVYYAQEGRMYTFLIFLVLLTYNLALLHKDKKISPYCLPILLAMVGTMGMYTHYYYALSLAGISLALLITTGKRFWPWLIGLTVTAIAFSPWIFVVLGIIESGGQEFRKFTFSVLPYTFFRFVSGYGILPLTPDLKADLFTSVLDNWLLLSIFIVPFAIASIYALQRARQQRDATLIFSALLFPPIAATLISLKVPMLSERYLIVSFPFFLMMLSLAPWGSSKGRIWASTRLLIFGLLGFALSQHYFNPAFGNTNWREACEHIKTRAPQVPVVLVNPSFIAGLASYYLEKEAKVFPIDSDRTMTSELSDIAKAVGQSRLEYFWLLERGTAESLVAKAKKAGYSTMKHLSFPRENGVNLFLLARPEHFEKSQTATTALE